ncbi:MAG TPA: hypothetical protein PKI32_10290, partial [Opitutales bacterium]|nr:hypothetical protein [Opitutales bacterium]
MRNVLFVFAAVLATAHAAPADPFEVALWRGETAVVRVPDYTELGEAPEGISVRVGVMKPVKYLTHVYRLQRSECFDRVEWGAKEIDGPRVAEITAPMEAKPGLYRWGLMDIRIVDRVFPPAKAWKYYLDLWQHPWASARLAKAEPFSDAHYAAMRPVWELLASAGQKTLTVTLVDRPWNHQCRDAYGSLIGRMKNADGSWSFDYSLFDRYVRFGRECGLGPHIACYTMCPWGNVVRWKNARGEIESAVAAPGTKEFEDFWGDFIVDFAAHLKKEGWFSDAYIAMDERDPKDVTAIATFILKRAPGMKIAMAGNRKPSEFADIAIDSYSQYIGHITPEFLAEIADRRAKGFVTTYYVCCGPEFPNTFLCSMPDESFWIGVYPGMVGLDGFLRWAWNSWGEDPMRD